MGTGLLLAAAGKKAAGGGAGGGFPSFAEAPTESTDATLGLAHTVEVPAHAAGDRLMLIVGNQGGNQVDAVSDLNGVPWVQVTSGLRQSAVGVSIWELVAGAEQATPTTVATTKGGSNGRVGAFCIKLADAAGIIEGATLAATTRAPNPPAVTPSGGLAKYLWLTGWVSWDSSYDVAAWPADYIDNQSQILVAQIPGMALATRELETDTEDPGIGATNGAFNNYNVAYTVAVAVA